MNGLHFTRPGVARREVRVLPAAPLSQQDMLESQRRLYNLGLFNEVDTAIQNPDGTESRKNVLVSVKDPTVMTKDKTKAIEKRLREANQQLDGSKYDREVEFALKTKNNSIGVAEYQLQAKLPAEFKGQLPTAKQLADAVRAALPPRR